MDGKKRVPISSDPLAHDFFQSSKVEFPTLEVAAVGEKKKKLTAQSALVERKKADHVAQLEDENATLKFQLVSICNTIHY